MGKVSIMYSGGLDSFIAYHYAIAQGLAPELFYVDLGHPYADKEKHAIKRNALPYQEIDLSSLYGTIEHRLTNHIFPLRNILLAVIGGMLNDRVWICALDGEQNGKEKDKSPHFFDLSTDLLTYCNDFFQDNTIVETPFANLTKAGTIKWAIANGVAVDDLFNTSSCYHPMELKCGTCLTCVKRWMAFKLAGLNEPGYASPPDKSEYFDELKREIPRAMQQQDFTRFSPKRISEFRELSALL